MPDTPINTGRYIGYTQGGPNQEPTLYFENGRFTQEHGLQENIGWHAEDGIIRANVRFNQAEGRWDIALIPGAANDSENQRLSEAIREGLEGSEERAGMRDIAPDIYAELQNNTQGFLFEVSPDGGIHPSRGVLIQANDPNSRFDGEYAQGRISEASLVLQAIQQERANVEPLERDIAHLQRQVGRAHGAARIRLMDELRRMEAVKNTLKASLIDAEDVLVRNDSDTGWKLDGAKVADRQRMMEHQQLRHARRFEREALEAERQAMERERRLQEARRGVRLDPVALRQALHELARQLGLATREVGRRAVQGKTRRRSDSSSSSGSSRSRPRRG